MKEHEVVSIIIPEAHYNFGGQEFVIRQMPNNEMFRYWEAQRREADEARKELRERIEKLGPLNAEDVLVFTYKNAEKTVAFLFRKKLDEILKLDKTEALTEDEKEQQRIAWVSENIQYKAEIYAILDKQDELNGTEDVLKKSLSLLGEEILLPWRRQEQSVQP